MWVCQLTTWGANFGVPKRGHFGCSKWAKIEGIPNGISQRQLRDQIHHSICHPLGVQLRLTCTWLPRISMGLGVVMTQTGSTTAKMPKSAISGDRPV